MKKRDDLPGYQFSLLLSILFVFMAGKIQAQCPLGPFAAIFTPSNGATFAAYSNYSPGTYFIFPMISGGSYAVSTCGSSIDTQLTCWSPTTNIVLVYNDDNGPLCSGSSASFDNFIPSFTAFMNIQVSQFNCQPGGSSSVQVFLRQNNNLSITSSSAAICAGQSRSLSALPLSVGTVTSTLYGSPGTFSGTGVSGTVFTAPTVTAPTVYTITYSFGYVSTTQTLLVNPNPVLSVNSGSICSGNSLVITPSGASTYTISGGNYTVSPVNSATYSVSGTSSLGCTGGPVVSTVSVFPSPTITASASHTYACTGVSPTLTASGAHTYTWTGGINGSSIVVNPTAPAAYSVTGTNTLSGCPASNTVLIPIIVSPQPTMATTDFKFICIGNTVVLSTGGQGLTYSWTGGVSGGVPFTPTISSTYSATGINTVTGCLSLNIMLVTVSVVPYPTLTVSAVHPSVCSGATTAINASGAAVYTVSGGAVVGAPFVPLVTTSYSITGSNLAGTTACTSSLSVVTITVLPSPTLSITQSRTLMCMGETNTLSVTGASSYTWSTGSNTTVTQIAPNVAGNTTYTVNGTAANGCTATAIVTQSVSECVGLTSPENGLQNISVHPNPNAGKFLLSMPLVGAKRIYVYDRGGKLISTFETELQNEIINLQLYSKGIYLCIVQAGGQYATLKILVE